MNKKKWGLFKKLTCLALTCVICSQFCGVTAFAAGQIAKFSLYHTPNGSPGENVMNWSKSVVTTKSPTTVWVERVGGGAVINAKTTNGIDSNFGGQGSASASTAVGKSVTLYVRYSKGGTSLSNPRGNYSY